MGSQPIQTRWACFVDGENFTMRGQESLKSAGLKPVRGKFWERNVLIWPPLMATQVLLSGVRDRSALAEVPHRMHFYTSVIGSAEDRDRVGDSLRDLGFQPTVLRGSKGRHSKGVDIALTCDMLSHASNDNYDVAVMIAGDGDYVPLVDEVKRLGKLVHVVFFGSNGLSPKLRRAGDTFLDLEFQFEHFWRNYKYPVVEERPFEAPEGVVTCRVRCEVLEGDVRSNAPALLEFGLQDRPNPHWFSDLSGFSGGPPIRERQRRDSALGKPTMRFGERCVRLGVQGGRSVPLARPQCFTLRRLAYGT